MERRSALYGFLVFGGLIALSFGFFFLLFSSMNEREPAWGGDGKGPRIGVVEINGVIRESKAVLVELPRVQIDTIKAGAMKDVGSPLRPMEAGERKFFQKLTDGIHEQFIDDVAAARKLDKNELRLVADGRVITGKEALEAKLVDQL